MLGTREERIQELKDRYPSWEAQTIWTCFSKNAEQFCKEPFLVFEDVQQTYGEVKAGVDLLARSLLACGVQPGDHVALLMNNCPEVVQLIFALAKIGAVRVPLHANIGKDELRQVMTQAGCMFIISDKQLGCEAALELPGVQGAVLLGGQFAANEKTLSWAEFLVRGEAVAEESCEMLASRVQDPFAVSNILFTSGSTSAPKGVIVTHDMVLRGAFGSVRRRLMETGRRVFAPIPLYHTMAYVEVLMTSVLIGGSIIMSRQKFEPEHALELLRRFGANDMICVPVIMINLLSRGRPDAKDYTALHALYMAGACPSWVWEAARSAFGVTDITTAYGMTECGSTTAMLSPVDEPDRVTKCHGRIKPGVDLDLPEAEDYQIQIKICDTETGEEVPAGMSGELRCFGPTVTKGYYNNPGATQRAFDENGWFRTGDICTLDRDGYLTFIGRNSDVYKINGENVSPQFVDDVIGRCPLVRRVETVGVLHPKYGEVGVAFIDTFAPYEQVRDEICMYCKENLAGYQVPKYFIDSDYTAWPRTVTGKVQKAKLRELAKKLLSADHENVYQIEFNKTGVYERREK